MTRLDAHAFICAHLRAGLLGGERPTLRDIAWETVIEVASFHYVTPALAWSLRGYEVPPDVRAYFDAMAARNAERNAQMLETLARVAASLNARGIEPVVLKGGALLAEEIYPDPSLRILGDLDVLIPAARADDAVAALKDAGFRSSADGVVPPPGHHHLPMLHDAATGTGVELHTHPVSAMPDAVIETDWFLEGVRTVAFRRQRVRVAEPTRNVGQMIFHSQIYHELFRLDKVHLRYLLDLAMLRARRGDAIEWALLDERFSAAGHGAALAVYLAADETLFGQAMPRFEHCVPTNALDKILANESRDGFHAQIQRMYEVYETLQNALSENIAGRLNAQQHAEQLLASLRNETEKNDALTADHRQLAEGHETLLAEHGQLERDFRRATGDHAQLEAGYRKVVADHDQVLSHYRKLESDYRQFLAGHEQVVAEFKTLESAYRDIATDHQQLLTGHRKLESDYRRVANDHTQVVGDYHRLEAVYRALLAGHERLLTQHRELETNVRSSTAAHEDLLADYCVLEEDRGELATRHEQSLGEYHKLETDYRGLAARHEQTLGEHHKLETDYRRLVASHEQLLTEHRKLEENNSRLDASLNGIITSRFWRMTRPVRRIMGLLHPPGAKP